jgi:hypothetical protein
LTERGGSELERREGGCKEREKRRNIKGNKEEEESWKDEKKNVKRGRREGALRGWRIYRRKWKGIGRSRKRVRSEGGKEK